jgi:hypothetical protein
MPHQEYLGALFKPQVLVFPQEREEVKAQKEAMATPVVQRVRPHYPLPAPDLSTPGAIIYMAGARQERAAQQNFAQAARAAQEAVEVATLTALAESAEFRMRPLIEIALRSERLPNARSEWAGGWLPSEWGCWVELRVLELQEPLVVCRRSTHECHSMVLHQCS